MSQEITVYYCVFHFIICSVCTCYININIAEECIRKRKKSIQICNTKNTLIMYTFEKEQGEKNDSGVAL